MRKLLFFISLTTFFYIQIAAQTAKQVSFGLGFSTSIYLYYPDYRLDIPRLPLGLNFNFKYKANEILIGSDLYMGGPLFDKDYHSPVIYGGQLEYRYHFFRQDKKYNLFLNSTLQYVQYQNQCLSFARPYYADPSGCDQWPLLSKSIKSTYGIGVGLSFMKYFYGYAVFGLGINYCRVNYFDGSPFESGIENSLITSFRLGLLFRVQ